MTREYILYCDESIESGFPYSDFYGGALLCSHHFDEVVARLEGVKRQTIGKGEIKWTKVSLNYCDRYIQFVDAIFDEVEAGRLKLRVMFRDSRIQVPNLTEEQRSKRYFLLYYQFIKHAFGLQFADKHQGTAKIRLHLDELPDRSDKANEFKMYIEGLSQFAMFKDNNIHFDRHMISEIQSDKHIILQAIDLVLGAMQFRLNNKHKIKPEGKFRRGKRTIAKEKVYKHINLRIRQFYPYFNVGLTTGHQGELSNRWHHAYRHWKFKPNNGEPVEHYDEEEL